MSRYCNRLRLWLVLDEDGEPVEFDGQVVGRPTEREARELERKYRRDEPICAADMEARARVRRQLSQPDGKV